VTLVTQSRALFIFFNYNIGAIEFNPVKFSEALAEDKTTLVVAELIFFLFECIVIFFLLLFILHFLKKIN
jgi:hypothetical protein